MHELSLADGILRLIEQARARDPFERVTLLKLEAGALSGVEISSLRFALEAVAAGTCLAQARIEIDEPAATAWCMACSQSVAIRSRIDPCPQCGGFQLQPTGGTELRVIELLVT